MNEAGGQTEGNVGHTVLSSHMVQFGAVLEHMFPPPVSGLTEFTLSRLMKFNAFKEAFIPARKCRDIPDNHLFFFWQLFEVFFSDIRIYLTMVLQCRSGRGCVLLAGLGADVVNLFP